MMGTEVVTPDRAALAWRDPQYEDTHVAEAERHGDTLVIRRDDGWSLGVPYDPHAPATPGTRLRCWGKGVGCEVRGVALGDVVLRYETEAEMRARFDRELAEQRTKRIAKAEQDRPDHDRRIAALPAPFRQRIEAFRAAAPDFWWDLEGYELFVCEQAAVFADALGSDEAVRAFSALSYDEQRARVPAMSDDHSGNTFGAACVLARVYLLYPEQMGAIPGALSPIVGSAAYGVTPASEATS